MEIIKRGYYAWKQVSKYRCTCFLCETVFTFTPDELISTSSCYKTIICPVCGKECHDNDFDGFTAIEWKTVTEVK